MKFNEKSVHLQDWPSIDDFQEENNLIEKMDFVRQIVSVALSIRKINNLRDFRKLIHDFRKTSYMARPPCFVP